MACTAQEETAHGDIDHGFGDVGAGFVVAHEASPVREGVYGPPHRPRALGLGDLDIPPPDL